MMRGNIAAIDTENGDEASLLDAIQASIIIPPILRTTPLEDKIPKNIGYQYSPFLN